MNDFDNTMDQLVRKLDRFKTRGEWDAYLFTWKTINALADAAEPPEEKVALATHENPSAELDFGP